MPPDNVHIVYKPSATFTDETVCDFIDQILPDSDGLNLIIDSAKPHKTAKLAAHAESKNINLIIIPPGMTNLLQPADVCWFSEI